MAFTEPYPTSEPVVARDGRDALDYLLPTGAYATHGGGDPKAVMLDQKSPKTDDVEVLHWFKTSRT